MTFAACATRSGSGIRYPETCVERQPQAHQKTGVTSAAYASRGPVRGVGAEMPDSDGRDRAVLL